MTRKLVLVNGLWATGKTTLASRIATEHSWPLLSHDLFKERMFERYRPIIFRHFKCFNKAAYEELLQEASSLFKNHEVVVIEAMFDSRFATPLIQQFIAHENARVLQIHLNASIETRAMRAANRVQAGHRHVMHAGYRKGFARVVVLAHMYRRFQTGYTKATHHFFSEPLHLLGNCQLYRMNNDSFSETTFDGLTEQVRNFANDC